MHPNKRFVTVLLIALIALLTIGPIFAKGKPDNPGKPEPATSPANNGSQNNNKPDNAAKPQPTASTVDNTTQNNLLGCQKNNPSRLDCSSLEVRAVCEGNVAVFTIRNTGEAGNGDMRAPTQYRLMVDGVVVETGTVQLAGGATMQITYSGGGTVTLEADQQIGHPGGSLPQATVNCSPPTVTATATPTEEVTPTPEEPTPTIEPAILTSEASCLPDTMIRFTVYNSGGSPAYGVPYWIYDANGELVESSFLDILPGESWSIELTGYSLLTLVVGDNMTTATADCQPPTEEPAILTAEAYCLPDNMIRFTVFNSGGSAAYGVEYWINDTNSGELVANGSFDVLPGESWSIEISGYSALTLVAGNYLASATADCQPPTEEPTPTEEVTPTPEPTVEETPTPEPTEPPTQLGCQKNNPERLDCSSLQVTAVCEGNVAVFTITNTGEAGDGDMRAPTQYRIIVDGVVVEVGSVQITGGTTMQVSYSGGGTVTLEADQQVGHPGGSLPQATIACNA